MKRIRLTVRLVNFEHVSSLELTTYYIPFLYFLILFFIEIIKFDKDAVRNARSRPSLQRTSSHNFLKNIYIENFDMHFTTL